jgi:hypothetical protein
MAVFSPTNAKVHFKAYDGNFTDALGNTGIVQNHGVTMDASQAVFGQTSMYMGDFKDSITFSNASLFDVGTGDYTVGFWFHPTQFTSYDRLFATNTHENSKPIRIYCHNGTIQVYAEDSEDADSTATDLLASYYLGADGENQWHHIMVRRELGDTRLYVNGTHRDMSTMSYEIDNSASPTLGADINAAATGIKGYIQDFFWTAEAITFNGNWFDPSSASKRAIAFANGVPTVNSFSTSGNSVENSGDSVTLSWDVSGETQLYLRKTVGATTTSEDVLGLSSKSVIITEAVSYEIQAVNATYGTTTSDPVTITLSGGNNMAYISDDANKPGLVLQKKMLDESAELAAVLKVAEPESGLDKNLNEAFAEASTQRGALSTALSAEVSARISDMSVTTTARANGDLALEIMLDGNQSELSIDLAQAESNRESRDTDQSSAIAAELVTMNAAVASLATARGEADVTLTTAISDMEDARVAAVATESAAMLAGDNAVAALLATEESEEDASLASLSDDRIAGDAALSTNLAAEESARSTEVAAKEADRIAGDATQSAALDSEEATYASAIAAEQSAMESVDIALEGELSVAIADRSAAVSSEKAQREAADAIKSGELSSAVLARENAITTEAGARVAADAALQGEIDDEAVARAADVSVAVAARSAMDVSLSNELDAAINARIAAVAGEESSREDDFLSIANLLSDEESNRAAAVSSLATKRGDDDATQSAAMSTQAALRSTEMSSELVSMEAGDNALIANLNTEKAARLAGDAAVSTSLKVLTDRLDFSGDGAGGGDFVMTDAGSGVAVTAQFVKVAGTNVVKMFIS